MLKQISVILTGVLLMSSPARATEPVFPPCPCDFSVIADAEKGVCFIGPTSSGFAEKYKRGYGIEARASYRSGRGACRVTGSETMSITQDEYDACALDIGIYSPVECE